MNWYAFAACLVFQVLGLVVFMRGFFPDQAVMAEPGKFHHESPFAPNSGKDAQFDRLIVMVVDAMRSDFVFSYESSMAFVHSLIRNGSALPFTAYAPPPTVTLPRLKGITTGSAPNFFDAVINVADDESLSRGYKTDLWLRQFNERNKTMHFFGDDTWLKLYPKEYFSRYEGTNSFFVSDFTEVDRNVTRHLDEELQSDWDVLVLHYLGLDHIGHKGGASSVYMGPKQAEMDDVVRRLYESMSDSTLFVLLGDHGMTDKGNHGGSTEPETHPGMVLISPRFGEVFEGEKSPVPKEGFSYHAAIDQVDLVPTLAALFNFPIPSNSMGKIIPQVLALWEDPSKVVRENCAQLVHLLKSKCSESEHKRLVAELDSSSYAFLVSLQGRLSSISADYKMPWLFAGIGMVVLVVIISLVQIKDPIFIGLSLVYSVHFHASLFIEEEHQIWWLLLVLQWTFLKAKGRMSTFAYVTVLLCQRTIRGWNISGQKYLTEYTIGEFLESHPGAMWLAIVATYTMATYSVFPRGNGVTNALLRILLPATSVLSLLFKAAQYELDGHRLPLFGGLNIPPMAVATRFRDAFILLVLLRLSKRHAKRDLAGYTTLFLLHQSRHANIPLFVPLMVTRRLAVSDPFLHLCLQNVAFFGLGNTNLLATIDLSNAYNGIRSYDIVAVTLLTFVSNFAPVLFWLAAGPRQKPGYAAFFYGAASLQLLVLCVNMRYHLFVWSVFSPRLLYLGAWVVFVNGTANVLYLMGRLFGI